MVILGDLGRFFANLEKNNVKGFDEFKNHFGKVSEEHYQWIMDGAEQAVVGTEKDDTISASSEKPYLFGREGNDVLKGSNKNDFLYGDAGSDTYYFNRGDGRDRIKENDFRGNPRTDRLVFGDDMLNLIFEKQGYDMKISLANSKGQIIIENWGYGKQTEVEEFYSADNKVLHSHKIDLFIQAMAAYTQESGMTWNQAIQERRDDVQNIYNQFRTNN